MPRFGICNISYLPLRKDPSHRSEMVSQVLLGETFDILEQQDLWSRLRLHFDGYEGWVENGQLQTLSEAEFQELQEQETVVVPIPTLNLQNEHRSITAWCGSTIYDVEQTRCRIGTEAFIINGSFQRLDWKHIAMSLLETPYLWGGRTTSGLDCSGFVQTVFKTQGINLPRDASQQAGKGQEVAFEDLQEGDLAFFRNENGHITHVGIVLENDHIIHATSTGGSKVRIDQIRKEGIWNEELGRITHEWGCGRRVL